MRGDVTGGAASCLPCWMRTGIQRALVIIATPARTNGIGASPACVVAATAISRSRLITSTSQRRRQARWSAQHSASTGRGTWTTPLGIATATVTPSYRRARWNSSWYQIRSVSAAVYVIGPAMVYEVLLADCFGFRSCDVPHRPADLHSASVRTCPGDTPWATL
jgi:hypothetical protein